mgnify:CR=1 FL=1
MKVSQAVAMRIREILAEKNMSQYKLEKLSGLSKGTMTSLMYARYSGVNLTTLIVIIRTLGLSIDEFFKSPLFSEENLEDL